MIPRIISFSIRNRFLVIAGALALILAGLYSVARTPVDAIPDLSENQVIVFADWMGRSPQEIEDQVTYPLSVNLQGLAGVKAVRSTSEFNFSMINIIFEDKVDFYFARERVLERLSTASTFLPEGVVPYLAPDATALGQIYWYTVEGGGKDIGELRAIQDWYVRYQLNSVPGVAQVSSVGGFVKSYEIALDPNRLRAYGITLGEVIGAVSRSNSAVGGNVFMQEGSEYLVRGVGWIEGLSDIGRIVVAERNGVPVTVAQVGSVQIAPEARRSVLEKNGQEAVGGVVLMRYGENPLEITKRIEKKIADLQPGLPEGVRIVPFYDRTRLIEGAIHTVRRTLTEEMVIASIAILLILTHVGSAFVVVLTLPLAVLVSFILMRLFGIPSNIMSLSGIAISIGILVDAAIVMVENASHELTRVFGRNKVTGDIRPIVERATQLVGAPIFFSILIMLLSFLPVFALSGMEGKMFHPLAFTKTFAMIGVALLSITLVPALLPIFLKGRLHSETDNPLVRSFIEIYRPVLAFLMRHPKPFVWSFVVLLGIGFGLSKQLGREFMPPLNEGTILEMPVTVPNASAVQVRDDIRVRDTVLRSFPETDIVVGKAGRADTPTDPAPLDMIETVVNLRPTAHWPKRHVRFDDAYEESGKVLALLQERGIVSPGIEKDDAEALRNEATMEAIGGIDETLRRRAEEEQQAFEPVLTRDLAAKGIDELVAQLDARHALVRPVPEGMREELAGTLAGAGAGTEPAGAGGGGASGGGGFGARFVERISASDVSSFLQAARDSLARRGYVDPSVADPFRLGRSPLDFALAPLRTVLGKEEQGFEARTKERLEEESFRLWKKRTREIDYALSDVAPHELATSLAVSLEAKADARGLSRRDPTEDDLAAIWSAREKPLTRKLFLWRKTKDQLVQEMDTALQMPGWGNIWTQPIINRIDMLATGVRTMVGVKVFGTDLDGIQKVAQEVASVLRGVPGAVDVFPDQIVGENYLDIRVDREKAARYGVNVGDVQDVIETAIGGKTITTTVEGRRRFPVRVRYARDFRDDETAIGDVLVAGSVAGAPGGGAAGGTMGGGAAGAGGSSGGAGGGGGGMGGMSGGSSASASGGMGGMGSGGAGAPSMPAAPLGGSAPDFAAAAGQASLNGSGPAGPLQVPLREVADIRVVQGPSMIQSENGMLRAYVQLNVRDRDVVGFVEDAQRVVREKVSLPQGYFLEWSGQFEHQVRAKKTLEIVFPAVIVLILLILYLTFRDVSQALLMVLAVPGALVGGVIFQTLFGFHFSVAVWVGYIAAFGMATETGIVMMVYLRDAIARRGGLAAIGSEEEVRDAVMEGAVHRLRPKLLTEAVAIVGLVPMLWAHGTGAEVMRPMVAPVLGGLLVADEVIDLLIPVLFHWLQVTRWRRLRRTAAEAA